MEISTFDIQTAYQTAKNMINRGTNYLPDNGYCNYFWDDLIPGILLQDGQFHDFYAIQLDTGEPYGVLTDDNQETVYLIDSKQNTTITSTDDLESTIQELITTRNHGK